MCTIQTKRYSRWLSPDAETGGAERRAVNPYKRQGENDPALLARRFWALPSCSPARRVRPASGLLPHRSHGGRLPLLSPGRWPLHPFRAECPSSRGQMFHPVRRAGLPLSAGADENPPPAKPEGLTPRPTLPVTLSGSMGERPSPSRLKALSDTAPA